MATLQQLLEQAEDIIRRKNTELLLQRKEIAKILKDNDSAAKIRSEIYGLKNLTPTVPSWVIKPGKAHKTGVPMLLLSDWHWGETVDPAQVAYANAFNRAIAKERVKTLAAGVIDLCFNHMVNPEYPGLVLMLAGDFITGAIHEDLAVTNDGPVMKSVLEVQEALIWVITELRKHFKSLFIPCVVGNHGRTTLKPRSKNRVFESYEWNIYNQLEARFQDDPAIKFMIPEETDARFDVQNHRFLLSHGDSLAVKGGDGIIGAIGPIARGAVKLGRSEATIGRDFDTLVLGHYHTYIPRGDALPVVVNPCLIGYNEYARLMLRVPVSRPAQALWFMHPKHGFTAQWPIYLDEKRKTADATDWVSWQQKRRK